MKDRAMTLGLGSAMAAALAVSISLYTTARAQTATTVPPAGPRGVTGPQDLQRPATVPLPPQFAGGGGGSEGIAADQGMVFVLRGNVVFIIGRDPGGRFRVVDRVEIPGGRPNTNGPRPRQEGNPPPPGK